MIKWLIIIALFFCGSIEAEIKILAFAASSSKNSMNRNLLDEAATIAKDLGATVTIIDLKDFHIPIFDLDDEAKLGMPDDVKKLRQYMIASDAFLIATPEYNAAVPGILKNDIDWASRSEDAKYSPTPFKSKKFAIMTISWGPSGGYKVLANLNTILENLGGIVVGQLVLHDGTHAFDSNGLLKDLKAKEELKAFVSKLIN